MLGFLEPNSKKQSTPQCKRDGKLQRLSRKQVLVPKSVVSSRQVCGSVSLAAGLQGNNTVCAGHDIKGECFYLLPTRSVCFALAAQPLVTGWRY